MVLTDRYLPQRADPRWSQQSAGSRWRPAGKVPGRLLSSSFRRAVKTGTPPRLDGDHRFSVMRCSPATIRYRFFYLGAASTARSLPCWMTSNARTHDDHRATTSIARRCIPA